MNPGQPQSIVLHTELVGFTDCHLDYNYHSFEIFGLYVILKVRLKLGSVMAGRSNSKPVKSYSVFPSTASCVRIFPMRDENLLEN